MKQPRKGERRVLTHKPKLLRGLSTPLAEPIRQVMNAQPYKFQFVAGNLALDFANTIAYRFHPAKVKDHLQTADEIRQWAHQARLPHRESIASSPRITQSALRRIRAVREQIFAVFHAIAGGQAIPPDSVRHIDDALRACQAKRCLSIQRQKAHWDWRPGAGYFDFLLYPVLVAAVDLLTSGPLDSVRHCADPTCGWLFLDRSNAGRRRWCTMADCGNRNKVRQHYQRKAASVSATKRSGTAALHGWSRNIPG